MNPPNFPAPQPLTHAQRFDARMMAFDAWLARSIGQKARYAMEEVRRMAGQPMEEQTSEGTHAHAKP